MAKRPTAWSFTAFNNWRLCPKQYHARYFLKQKGPETAAMKRGREVHEDLAKYIQGTAPELSPVVKNDYQKTLYAWMRDYPHKIVEQQWGYNRGWRPTGWFAKDTWFRSVLDVLLQYMDMTGEVVDHKTGKVKDDYADQMELFAISAFIRFPTAQKIGTRLIYLDAETERFDEFEKKDLGKLIDKWEAAIKPMWFDVDFHPRPNEYCKYCELGRSKGGDCPHG